MLRVARLFRPLLGSQPGGSTLCTYALYRHPSALLTQPERKQLIGFRPFFSDSGHERTINPATESALKKRDGIPSDYSIIYRAPLETYIKVTYITTWVSILIAPVVVGSMMFFGDDRTYPYEINGIPLFESATDAYILTAILVLTTVNVGRIISKYPFRMYRNPKENKYIAVFQNFLPLMVRRVAFAAGEVRKNNGFLWADSCYAIKKKKVLLVPEHFSTPIELERMQIDPKLTDPVEIRKRRSKML